MDPSSISYQDLSSEQVRSQELSAKVWSLSQKLQKAEAELQTTTVALSQSREETESLSKLLKKSESVLQVENSSGSEELDANPHSDSSNKGCICQSYNKQTSHLDQSPEAGKGHNISMTHERAAGETERQLTERLIALEKEVCVCI